MASNNSRTSSSRSSGVGLTVLVFVAFLVLKLCGVITWSWWWVHHSQKAN